MSYSIHRPFLDATALHSALQPAGFGGIEVVETITSTNSVLAERVRSALNSRGAHGGAVEDFTVLMAEEQTQGRGRLNRSWDAPKSSQLIVSVAVKLPGFSPRPGTHNPGQRMGLLPLLTGISVATAVRRFTEREGAEVQEGADSGAGAEVPVTLKWPNDVQVDGRKLAGILVEAVQLDPVPIVIIGFGLNWDLSAAELPVPHATSLALEFYGAHPQVVGDDSADSEPRSVGGDDGRTRLASLILLELKDNIERFRNLGGAPETVLPRYRKLSATLGTDVSVHLPNGEIKQGRARDVDEAGELVVDVPGEGELVVAAGDVQHLRPAGNTDGVTGSGDAGAGPGDVTGSGDVTGTEETDGK